MVLWEDLRFLGTAEGVLEELHAVSIKNANVLRLSNIHPFSSTGLKLGYGGSSLISVIQTPFSSAMFNLPGTGKYLNTLQKVMALSWDLLPAGLAQKPSKGGVQVLKPPQQLYCSRWMSEPEFSQGGN